MNPRSDSSAHFFGRLRLALHGCHREVYGSTWAKGGIKEHSDPFSRLYYLRAGGAELHFSRGITRVVPHGLYLIPAHTPCRYRCPVSMDLSCIHFSAIIEGFGPLHHFVDWPVEVHPRNEAWIEERIDLLVDRDSNASFLMRDGALRQLLGLFDDASDHTLNTAEGSRFAPVLHHIEQNLSRRIHLAELAELIHLQPNYFSDLFRRQFGEAPTRYVQRRKIECAAELLVVSDISLQELTDLLGFTDAFHFSRTFKAFMGAAPSIYRKRTLNKV